MPHRTSENQVSLSNPPPWDSHLECEALQTLVEAPDYNRPQVESITLASVWRMASPAAAADALAGTSDEFVYRRDGHPNERSLSRKLARLHAAEWAMVTAQGMSAISAVGLALLRPGSTIWIGEELYGTSSRLLTSELARWGVNSRTFDPTQSAQLAELRRSHVELVFAETMSNPRLRVPDIELLAESAHQAGAQLVIDNTFATHLLCLPLVHGADVVIESLGKQVNGHSDAMLGLIATRDASLGAQLLRTSSSFGLASSPLDCYLTHRGLMTLALRLERACQNAYRLATILKQLPQVVAVDYPGLVEHAQHPTAVKQLRGGFGWMLTFHLNTDWQGISRLIDCLKPEIPFLPSLGDVITSVSHPASTSHRGLTADARQRLGITDGTVRVSCGIEPTDWLISRFEKAIRSS